MKQIDYGSLVEVGENYSDAAFAGKTGSVSGIYTVEDKRIADLRGCRIGDIFYLIEISDGSSKEIASNFVSKAIIL